MPKVLGSCDCASWAKCEERENQQDATIRCLLSTSVSTCFGHHYAHLQENKDRANAYGVLLWFCWMWLVGVVGRCVVGCEHYEGFCSTITITVLTSQNAAPHNRYQPHPAQLEQYTICIGTVFVLLNMGIMMPETCWDKLITKIWLLHLFGFLSLHTMPKVVKCGREGMSLKIWTELLKHTTSALYFPKLSFLNWYLQRVASFFANYTLMMQYLFTKLDLHIAVPSILSEVLLFKLR